MFALSVVVVNADRIHWPRGLTQTVCMHASRIVLVLFFVL